MKRSASYLNYVVCPGQKGGMCPVLVDDVVYFKGNDTHTTAFTGSGEHRMSTPLDELLPMLDPDKFLQVQRSMVVNRAHIEAVRGHDEGSMVVTFKDRDECITVGNAYCRQFQARQ